MAGLPTPHTNCVAWLPTPHHNVVAGLFTLLDTLCHTTEVKRGTQSLARHSATGSLPRVLSGGLPAAGGGAVHRRRVHPSPPRAAGVAAAPPQAVSRSPAAGLGADGSAKRSRCFAGPDVTSARSLASGKKTRLHICWHHPSSC